MDERLVRLEAQVTNLNIGMQQSADMQTRLESSVHGMRDSIELFIVRLDERLLGGSSSRSITLPSYRPPALIQQDDSNINVNVPGEVIELSGPSPSSTTGVSGSTSAVNTVTTPSDMQDDVRMEGAVSELVMHPSASSGGSDIDMLGLQDVLQFPAMAPVFSLPTIPETERSSSLFSSMQTPQVSPDREDQGSLESGSSLPPPPPPPPPPHAVDPVSESPLSVPMDPPTEELSAEAAETLPAI